MLIVHFNAYADFLAAAKEFKPLHVLYEITAGGVFGVQVYVENKNVVCGFSDTSTPGSFSSDFPQAILMTVLPYLNPPSGQQF